MAEHGYGRGYLYAHDFDGALAPGQEHLPDALRGSEFYVPTERDAPPGPETVEPGGDGGEPTAG